MRYIAATIIILTALVAGFATGTYVAVSKNAPLLQELINNPQHIGTKIYSDDNVVIGELKVEKGTFIPLQSIPKPMTDAIIAVEDSRFWSHKGVDLVSIGRALFTDIVYRNPKQGGSTLTQQLAKVSFLTPQKTLKRKLMEAAMALKIESSLTKEQILELYLNRVYFGHGAYGIEKASRVYFGKPAIKLTLAEAALLAGLVKAPTAYSPFNDFKKAKDRQHIVLARMRDTQKITEAELQDAEAQTLQLSNPTSSDQAFSYFVEYVRKYLEDVYGEERVYTGGLNVYTSLNAKMQLNATAAVQAGLRALDKRRGWRGPIKNEALDVSKENTDTRHEATVADAPGSVYTGTVIKVNANEAIVRTRWHTGKLALSDAMWAIGSAKDAAKKAKAKPSLTSILSPGDVITVSIKEKKGTETRLALEQNPEVEAALIAIEPATGYILAMVGGYDYSRSDFNRVVLAKRQPGSAFKPIVYATAMDNKFTPASVIVDEPVIYKGGPNGEWSPENYDRTFHGPMRLREALTYSNNVVTVRLADQIGINTIINFAKKIGCTSNMPHDLSIALGSLNVSPLEMALMYSVFANHGEKPVPTPVKHITDRTGTMVEPQDMLGTGQQVISPETAYLITSMMQDVVQRGTGWHAKALGRPVAAKTGTTNDYKDAWFVGYTPDLVTAVWVGMDNSQSLGPRETGSKAASPIWTSFMLSTQTSEIKQFPVPKGITIANIDPKSGLLAIDNTGINEFFKEGTQPTAYAKAPSNKAITFYEHPDE